MKRDAAEEVKPKTCPFCGHTELTCSASGKQLMCRKCGRVVLSDRKPRGTRESSASS
jgi:ribosomal protein S27E